MSEQNKTPQDSGKPINPVLYAVIKLVFVVLFLILIAFFVWGVDIAIDWVKNLIFG